MFFLHISTRCTWARVSRIGCCCGILLVLRERAGVMLTFASCSLVVWCETWFLGWHFAAATSVGGIFLILSSRLAVNQQEDDLKQWELERCPLLVTEEPKMDRAQVVQKSYLLFVLFCSVFSFFWVVMATPGFQVFKILVDTRKHFFSVYCDTHISLRSTVCRIVSKYKACEQGRHCWGSSPMTLSVVSMAVPSENRDMEKHLITSISLQADSDSTPATIHGCCVATWCLLVVK